MPDCDDGIDNDGGLLVDFPADTGCYAGWDDSEDYWACGLGYELAFLLPPLMWLQGRGRRKAR